MPWEHLKYRYIDITVVAFWTEQEAEKEFTMPGENLKHRFLDLTQVAIWAVQEVIAVEPVLKKCTELVKLNYQCQGVAEIKKDKGMF